jgi:predicted nucleic acid-binding protein
VAVVYADSSALVKLVREEVETPSLRLLLSGSDLVSSELVVTELPRAMKRAAAGLPARSLTRVLDTVGTILDAIAVVPLDRSLLLAAGALDKPSLRSLDAIHIAAALALWPLDAFVSYDERQAAAARLAGIRTVAPGR